MKNAPPQPDCPKPGFTLVEVLTVIAIIGVLAALLLVVLPVVITNSRKAEARLEIRDIMAAVERYDLDYGHFPVSNAAQTVAGTGDFTYGGTFQTPTGTLTIGNVNYSTNNSEVIAILMDLPVFGNGTQTINYDHTKNPQRTIYLNAKMSGDASSTGVGLDGVYRDSWGNPYVISLDLNNDAGCEDALYESPAVSRDPLSGNGINGLILQPDGSYAAHSKVMVWSAGPDRKVENGLANGGANKDNVVGWK